MNTITRIILLAGIFIPLHLLHAQTMTAAPAETVLSLTGPDMSLLQSLSDVQLEAFADTLKATPTVPAAALPGGGNFWSLQNPQWPPLPYDSSRSTAWQMNDGGYLLNDLNVDYQALANSFSRGRTSQVRPMGMDDLSPPGDGGGDTNYDEGGGGYIPDYGTNLWIAQWKLTSGTVTGFASNTIADVMYEVLTNTDLATTNWGSTGLFFYGSETTNWTPMPVMTVSLTNNCFFRLRSWIDSDNVGIPDWWQIKYFGYVGIDPYGNPAGDGYNNLYKFANGLNPTSFVMPPAPNNFVAVVSTNGTNVLLSWDAAQGTVTNYSIVRGIYNSTNDDYDYTTIGTVSASTTSFVDTGAIQNVNDQNDVYNLTANYPGGNSSQTASSPLYYSPPPSSSSSTPAYNISVSAMLVRNATGRWQLMFSDLSANVQTIQLTWTVYAGNFTTQNISASVVTNGIYQIPDADIVNYLGDIVSVQGFDVNGNPGAFVQIGVLPNDAPYFVDGRQHLKQNLNFLIRGAAQTQPFFAENGPYDGGFQFDFFGLAGDAYAGQFDQSSTNFEEFSFLHHGSYGSWPSLEDMSYFQLDNLWPFTANYDLANYLVNTSRTNLPFGSTNFTFYPDFATNVPASPVLAHADPYWILQPHFCPDFNGEGGSITSSTTNWAVTVTSTQTVASLASGSYNLFGLPYQAGCEVDMQFSGYYYYDDIISRYQVLEPGDSVTANSGYLIGDYASWCPAPTLVVSNYYFAPLINPNANPMNLPGTVDNSGHNVVQYPTPLDDTFHVTNQTPPVIIGAIGQPMIVGGWAKFAIENGSTPTGKFAYLGQYFVTNAFLLDDSGNATTNSAGIISPYGEFFPTQAGKARLITMPDIDTGQQGTNIVRVISLNVDANHDDTMDLSYFGQDQTSPGKPYVFWCNNNFDRWNDDSPFNTEEQDDMEGGGDLYTPDAKIPDCNYLDAGGNRIIPDTRDLEDFSRLWITGVTPDLVSTLPAGSTVTLSWGDVGSPNQSNPTIDLFQATDGDGGLGYLTNETAAGYQIDPAGHNYLGRVSPGQSVVLNANAIANYGGNHFIWCGVTNGSGKLSLTFLDPNNRILGQASVYIQIKDIKQMFERWTVGDVSSQLPATTAHLAQDNLPAGQAAFQYGPATTNTPYILLVHGYNMQTWEKARYAETAFKRLWWQGYQGRFGAFDWPTAGHFYEFGSSELQAWQSAQGLLNKLNDLNAEYPGQVYLLAHSLGNVVAGEALRLASSSQAVNTYVAMQGAVSAHAYDPTTATYTLTEDWGAPDRYAQYYTNGAPCYFNASAGAGNYVNFFNTNDWALNFWLTFQNSKPILDLNYSFTPPDSYFKNSGSTELFFPTNTYELFDEIIQSRSYALGAQSDAGGVFDDNQANLPTVWPPDAGQYKAHIWHSAEFRSDSAQRWQFWDEVLIKMNLKQPQQ